MRRGRFAMGLALAGLLAAAAAPAPAAAAASLELSADGVRFSSAFPGPLFPSGRVLVPGDVADARFWVRNGGTSPAWVSLGLNQGVTGARAYLRALTLTVDVDGTTQSRPLDGGGCIDLAAPMPVRPGQRVEVALSLGFSGVTGRQAQREIADLTFHVSMTDAVGVRAGLAACALAAMPPSRGTAAVPAASADAAGEMIEGSQSVDGRIELAGPRPQVAPNTRADDAGHALTVWVAAAIAGASLRLWSARRDGRRSEGET